MWSLNSPSEKNFSAAKLSISEVLYFYDGPQIFSSRFGIFDAICVKIDEIESDGLYIIAATTSEKLAALKAGKLSVRGALWRKDYFIAQVGPDFLIRRLWSVDQSELPIDMLPEAGAGLRAHFGKVVDTLEQTSAFFALRFAGETLAAGRMAFRTFKDLVDDSYALVRLAFAPPSIANRHSLFDFDIAEPAFGSLVIAVQEPTINSAGLQRAQMREVASRVIVSSDSVRSEMNHRRQVFFEQVQSAIEISSKRPMSEQQAAYHFDVLHQINDVVPTSKNAISSVEFSANSNGFSSAVYVDDIVGARLRDAYLLAELSPINEIGSVIEQNSESSTFIIKNALGRQITCELKRQIFEQMSDAGELNIGTRLSVAGKVKRRKRRDFVYVDGRPFVVN